MERRKRDSPHRMVVMGSAAPIGPQPMDAEPQSNQVYFMAALFGASPIGSGFESIFRDQREVGKG